MEESMRRMHTDYLDIVYAHDVEFVSVDRAVEAVGELFRLKVRSLGLHPIVFQCCCRVGLLYTVGMDVEYCIR